MRWTSRSIQPGDIIECLHGDGHILVGVTGEVSGQKLIVVMIGGDTLRVPFAHVSLHLDSKVDPEDSLAFERRLNLIEAGVTRAIVDVDLATLWELANEVGRGQTIDQLIELMLGEVDDTGRLALIRAMRDDPAFFKEVDALWVPRSSNVVEDMVAQRQVAGERAAIRDQFVQGVADLMKAPSEARPMLVDALTSDPARRGFWQTIQDAATVEDFLEAQQAERLLADVEKASGVAIRGEGRFKAFQLMRDLGVWSEHEDLKLIRYKVTNEPNAEIVRLAATTQLPEDWRDAREDYTGWYTLTIDDASSLDLDDAISVRPTLDGGWEVAIHIADPSAMVPKGSELDAWARARGTSIYLPTGAISMLPEVLSDGEISLHAGVERPAVTLQVSYDEELTLTDWRFVPSRIRVDRKLSYDEADMMLDSESHDHVAELLGSLAYIADERLFERTEAGAVSIALPEARLKVELKEEVSVGHTLIVNSLSRQLIMELMVLYNHLAATYLNDHGCPAVYRVQDSPERDSLAAIDHAPQGYAREFARIKSMRKGEVSMVAGEHFGLGIYGYVQATSPIRRYGDIAIQRQIVALSRGQTPPYDESDLMEIVADVERATYEARVITRASERYWFIYLLSQVKEPLDAVVLHYKDDRRVRATVLLVKYGLRTLAPLRSHAAVGSTVQLRVERTDPRRDVLTFKEI